MKFYRFSFGCIISSTGCFVPLAGTIAWAVIHYSINVLFYIRGINVVILRTFIISYDHIIIIWEFYYMDRKYSGTFVIKRFALLMMQVCWILGDCFNDWM